MSFVTILALGIAAFVALPLFAHRLRRRRAEERAFPAAALVPPAPPRARRRSRLEDRALFGVRALAIAALALLGASPLVRCTRLSLSRSSGASMAVAIVIDDSMSMRAKNGSGNSTRFARAKVAASELLAGTRDGDAVGVILAGSPPRVALAPTTELDAVSSIVSSVTESDRGTDLEGAIRLAETLLSALPQVDKRVVVLSDLADGKPDAPPLGENALVPIWAPLAEIRDTNETAKDCALVSADDTGGRVIVHIACGKDVSAAGRRVEVRAGDRVVGSGTATAAQELSIDVPGTNGEALTAHLLGGDAIASDDVAPVLVSQAGAIGVVAEAADETAVTGGPPVVEQAFAALRSDLATRPLPAVPDQPGDFTGYFGLVVDDPPGFTPEQRRALTQYLEGGGVMLVALGPRASAAPLGATLQPLLDHATTWSESKSKGAKADAEAVLLGEAARSLVDVGAAKRTTLSPADIGSIENIVPWSDGAPLVARRVIGRGEVWIVTLPFALDASDLPLRPAFIALLDAFVQTTHTHAAPRRADVGATWTLPSSASAATGPSGPIELVREGGRVKLVPPLAGAYHVTIDGKDELRVAAPIARETDLRPRALKSQDAASHLGATQAQVDVSPHVAIVLLLLLFVEMVLRLRAQRTEPV
ncbi:MAG TPA: VWA domain-containing protein [Polyangiaceae bacterium]|nr:VWA domain-containing protein [Polyangiaceae bacterium]